MNAEVFESRRVARSYRQTIEARPDVVFPLLCPVRETEWLDGWAYTMIYTASGLVETGAVFTTSNPADGETTWIVTRHDSHEGVVEFARFTPGNRTCVLTVTVSADGDTRSHVDVSYSYTSIAPSGNAFLETWTEETFLDLMVFWEKSMNHFLKSGRRLSRAAA